MMTSVDAKAANLAKAKRLLSTIQSALEGTGFVVTATKTVTADMVTALEHLSMLASCYWESLQTNGPEYDAAALLDQAGLILERSPSTPHIAAALDSWRAILGPEATDPQAANTCDDQDATRLPLCAKTSLARARESLQLMEAEVDSLKAEVANSVGRLDARLDAMLTGPRPDLWAGTTEGFELQVLLLLELRFAGPLGFNPNNGVRLQKEFSAFLRPRFPHVGCRPLAAVTDDFIVMRQTLAAFRAELQTKHIPVEAFNRLASAAG